LGQTETVRTRKKNTLTPFGMSNEKMIYEENCHKPNTEIAIDAKMN
jgi:hypothetical protein